MPSRALTLCARQTLPKYSQSVGVTPQSTKNIGHFRIFSSFHTNLRYNVHFQDNPNRRTFSSASATSLKQNPRVTVTKSTDTSNAPPIIVSAACTRRLRQLASRKSFPLYLRVSVDAGGCSGFQYQFDLENEESDPIDPTDDVVVTGVGEGGEDNARPARVVIDRESLELMKGSTIDFEDEIIRSGFVIQGNPLSESACGCGSSFAVKNFQENPAVD
mmetsp:Transcript_28584/g.34820  ORF Transcript_28584/g.34820 Transcript_28584/m.34820 type:complete len:217 (-) Transcript_28584:384-1034(-)|eukprot:CAMPEP_0172501982 /NCGR_PEP_ID=MMETSP1066-20121228/155524_1 /TAXON_ID=671091 /ORGANISM="Coscinodiscus wailesii, Strain CCMP2513" /LENGTH=216 /DNA_ID=CAMNT_0013277075 /DNA_START=178 /DNA_END=828 /DNA_ORIENTATION=-